MKGHFNLIFLLAFLEGFCVMALEIIGAKTIGPYFGTSLYVWSATLAITLASLALGYFIGGRISLKKLKLNPLPLLFILCAVDVLIINILKDSLLSLLLSFDFKTGTIFSCLAILAFPLTLLGMTSPLMVHFINSSVEKTGKNVGSIYAISTIGGVMSSFFIGFYAIPDFGLNVSYFIVSGILLLSYLIALWVFKGKKWMTLSLLFPLFIYGNTKPVKLNGGLKSVYKNTSLNGELHIIDDLSNQTRTLLINNISQSYMHIPTGRSQWKYIHKIAAYSSSIPEGARVLLVGLGGGSLAGEFLKLGFKVDVCELDPRMDEISKKYFALKKGCEISIDDARHFIKTTKNLYHIIVLDISYGESQPANMYSLESFREIKKVMNSDGLLFLHYPSIYRLPEGLALRYIYATMKEAGLHPKLLNNNQGKDVLNEFVFVGQIHNNKLSDRNYNRQLPFSRPYNFPFNKEGDICNSQLEFNGGVILHDDQPVFDQLHNHLAVIHRKQSIKNRARVFK